MDQTREIAAEWYEGTSDQCWEDIVKALMCLGDKNEAKSLADSMGIDWKQFQDKKKT